MITLESLRAQQAAAIADKRYPGPFPRKKHSHRCETCGAGVYCYKTACSKPQRIAVCNYCGGPR